MAGAGNESEGERVIGRSEVLGGSIKSLGGREGGNKKEGDDDDDQENGIFYLEMEETTRVTVDRYQDVLSSRRK